jgi:hypothetical protein
MRFNHCVFFQQREKARHRRAESILFLKPLPVDCELVWIPGGEPANQRVTEIAGNTPTGDARYFGIVKLLKIDIRSAKLSDSL